MKTTITLSDPITKKQFNKSHVTYEVSKIINYGKVWGYITKEKNNIIYMLIVKKTDITFNPRIYYLDIEGDLKNDLGLIHLLNEKGTDLADHIEATIEIEEGTLKTITWHKKAPSVNINKNRKIAEYSSTGNENLANLCLIDWEGGNKKGTLHVWYGQKIKPSEFEITSIS